MKNRSLALVLLINLGMLGCAHSKDDSAEKSGSAAKDSCQSIAANTVCTMEYRPTTCTFAGKEFAASNPCATKILAKTFACENKVAYAEDQVVCDTKPVTVVSSEAKNCDDEKTACTREYQPQVCRFGDVMAKGVNHCEALNTLRLATCTKNIAFQDTDAVCESDSNSKSKKRSR